MKPTELLRWMLWNSCNANNFNCFIVHANTFIVRWKREIWDAHEPSKLSENKSVETVNSSIHSFWESNAVLIPHCCLQQSFSHKEPWAKFNWLLLKIYAWNSSKLIHGKHLSSCFTSRVFWAHIQIDLDQSGPAGTILFIFFNCPMEEYPNTFVVSIDIINTCAMIIDFNDKRRSSGHINGVDFFSPYLCTSEKSIDVTQ